VKALLLEPKFELVSALGHISLVEDDHDCLKAIMDYYDQYKMLIPLIEVAITNEIDRTSKSPTLFRDSSLATKLLSLYFFDGTGLPYLKHTVQPVLDVILSSDENLEVDPKKVGACV
jgi:GTPase-activator protein for Ras-like GTPase